MMEGGEVRAKGVVVWGTYRRLRAVSHNVALSYHSPPAGMQQVPRPSQAAGCMMDRKSPALKGSLCRRFARRTNVSRALSSATVVA